ncbi:MAG: tetratricopeptide repeat protein, partial [Ignavibacteriaceae bacterium]|nr:tetratricopeptide repeat protein [Ignavibacteriaceae bacterium]
MCIRDRLYANVLHFNMKYNDAEKIYSEVLEIKKGIYGENSPEYMGVYRDIANFYVNTERYPEAEKSVKKVLDYDLATYGENSQTYSSTLQDLGIIYYNLARYSLAEPLFIKALEIRKNLYGENDSLYATTLNNLSMLYKATGRFEDSEQGYIKTAKIFSKLKGENSLEFAISLNNLANLYSDLGRYADAEIMLFNSTEIKKEVLGVNHPDYATSLNNLAAFYILTNRYDKVENYLQEAIRIKTEFYGENSPSVLTSLSNLASVYEIGERYNEAKSLYSNILKIEEEIYGINSFALSSTLTKLAVVNLSMGNYGEAESYFKQSKTLFEVNGLQKDPEYSSLLSSLSNLLFIAGDIQGALEVGLKALEIKENIFGNSHPSAGISYFSLARIYESEGNYETADSFYNKYFENRKKIIPGFLLTLSESEKVKYLTEFRENYEVYLSFAGKYFGEIPSIAPSVFENNLFSKGLVFRSALNFMNTLENTQDPGVINLLTNWRNSKAELSRAYSFSKETENYYGINIDSLENRVEELEKSLYIKSYSVQSVEALINPEKIISQINDDEAYIDYFRFRNYNNGSLNDSIVYAAVIIRGVDGSEPLFISLPGGSQIEKFFYPKYKLEMRSENFDEPEEGADTDFYSVFFKPVRDLTPGVNTFYISPDGVINKMNLYTLYNPESGKFLIDELTIRTINNPAIFFSDSNKDLEPVSGFFAGYPNYDLMPDTLSLDELFTLSRDIDITPALTDTLTRYNTSLLPGTKTEVLFCDSIFRSSGKLSETAIWDDACLLYTSDAADDG